MLSGLMSRCTTPSLCAYPSAFATSPRMPTISAIESDPAAIRSWSDWPFTNGIT